MLQGLYQESSFSVALVRSAGAGFTFKTRGCGVPAGLAPVTRTGAGDYNINLTAGIPAANCHADLTPVGVANVGFSIEHVSDTQKRIRTFTANTGVALDTDFDVAFAQLTGT